MDWGREGDCKKQNQCEKYLQGNRGYTTFWGLYNNHEGSSVKKKHTGFSCHANENEGEEKQHGAK
jgi:hypothetical protein